MNRSDRSLDINYASDLDLIQSMFDDDSLWDRILQAKLDFLNFGIDPRTSADVRPEIAESWIISKEKGLSPDATALGEFVTESFLQEALDRSAAVVEETRKRISTVESLQMVSDYMFELIDPTGLPLVQVGDLRHHQFVGNRYYISERNSGTNCHALAMRHKKPFILIGPEHYCFALHSVIACAAPLLDQFDTVVGALLFTQTVPDEFTAAEKKLLVHTMSFISSMAGSISASLRLRAYDSEFSSVEQQYSQASHEAQLYEGLSKDLMSSIREAILVLSRDLVIQHANPEAGKLFGALPAELMGKPLDSLLSLGTSEEQGEFFRQSRQRFMEISGKQYQLRSKTTKKSVDDKEPSGYILLVKEAPQPAARKNGDAGDSALVTFEGILGKSTAIKRAKSRAKRFASAHENILITGESGTGKELFAQAIHNEACPEGPFMALNCAAIPPRLIESELFGYEAGAFTGADKQGRPGKIELANGGTLFLDEIGDMPLELQTTLLRVLENKRVMRVGGKSYKQVSFNLISATNRNLSEMAREGRFREDLLYRLSVLSVNLPPLRERKGDALFFANYYLNECQAKTLAGSAQLSEEAAEFVESYSWPGNVRQLKHAIYSAYYTCESDYIELDDFPVYITQGACGKACPVLSQNESYSPVNVQPQLDGYGMQVPAAEQEKSLPTLRLEELEALAIDEAMRQAGGNVTAAARILGTSKATLYRKLKK
ncbi:MAG: sigma-54-dependent Fis family transcriptional regulator [Coriobacteriales bacterium]